ncbi:MAG: IS607 family transposase [Promethearchaeota archaeon]
MNSSRYISIGIAANLLGVCPKTLRRWDRAGKLRPAFRTLGNHRRYDRQLVLTWLRDTSTELNQRISKKARRRAERAAIYGRASSSRQKITGDLARQLEGLREYCQEQGFQGINTYSDIGSGLNDRRKGLLRLLRDVAGGKLDVIVVNYRDRLARFGIQVLREFFSSWAVRLEIVRPTIAESSPHAELITDLTAILYSFMGKLYRLRRKT